jgi:hypothetical protein
MHSDETSACFYGQPMPEAQKISLERFAMIRPLRAVKQDDALLSTRRRLDYIAEKSITFS